MLHTNVCDAAHQWWLLWKESRVRGQDKGWSFIAGSCFKFWTPSNSQLDFVPSLPSFHSSFYRRFKQYQPLTEDGGVSGGGSFAVTSVPLLLWNLLSRHSSGESRPLLQGRIVWWSSAAQDIYKHISFNHIKRYLRLYCSSQGFIETTNSSVKQHTIIFVGSHMCNNVLDRMVFIFLKLKEYKIQHLICRKLVI